MVQSQLMAKNDTKSVKCSAEQLEGDSSFPCTSTMMQLWEITQNMLKSGGELRCTALMALVQFSSNLGVCSNNDHFNVKSDPAFWSGIRTALVGSCSQITLFSSMQNSFENLKDY